MRTEKGVGGKRATCLRLRARSQPQMLKVHWCRSFQLKVEQYKNANNQQGAKVETLVRQCSKTQEQKSQLQSEKKRRERTTSVSYRTKLCTSATDTFALGMRKWWSRISSLDTTKRGPRGATPLPPSSASTAGEEEVVAESATESATESAMGSTASSSSSSR